jgi:GT2 family glycosyltransferase
VSELSEALRSSSSTVSVVISTRNRKGELRRALISATALTSQPEILVIDDASDDGTCEMVNEEFPNVRLFSHSDRRGYVVRRNEGASSASGDLIVSIDDDADFSDPSCLNNLPELFADPRVAAAGLPYVDVISDHSGRVLQIAPDADDVWITNTFVGTAYAVRRDVFLKLGGFREELIHQGEERDFCLRLLERGHFVRLGVGQQIRHYPSVRRDLRRMDTFGRRNEILWAFTYLPWFLSVSFILGYTFRGMLYGLRVRRLGAMVEGIRQGYVACWELRSSREPLRRKTLAIERRLRKRGPMTLREVERHMAHQSD